MIFQIFILISIYGIYRIVREIQAQRKCPSDKVLRDVVLGIVKKNSAVSDRVIMHLGVCEDCQERARKIGSEY